MPQYTYNYYYIYHIEKTHLIDSESDQPQMLLFYW